MQCRRCARGNNFSHWVLGLKYMTIVDKFGGLRATTSSKRLGVRAEYGFAQIGQTRCGSKIIGIDWRPLGTIYFGDIEYGENERLGGIYAKRTTPTKKITIRMKYYVPKNTQQPQQQTWRSKFADAVANWQSLTNEQKEVYNKKAVGKPRSGYNIALREYMLS